MRRIPAAIVASLMCLPSMAGAHPLTVNLVQPAEGDAPADPTAAPTDQPAVDTSPTSSKAPDSTVQPTEPEPEPAPEPEPEPEGPVDDPVAEPVEEPTAEQQEVTLQEERKKVQDQQGQFNQHGIGARGGITVIPTWLLNSFLSAHTNALCRGETVGNFASDRGLLKQDGCNFYAGGEYIYRRSRIFDIVASVGYQHAHAPDGYWLDNSEWDPDSCSVDDQSDPDCNLAAADYTEVDLGLIFIEADFIARAPVVLTKDIELGIGGGAGIGLGIVLGDVKQTAIGSTFDRSQCSRLEDLADFTKCTPRWDPIEEMKAGGDTLPPDQLSPPFDATCSKDKCKSTDLTSFGYQKKQEDIPPVVPVVNLILSVRMIVKDVFGITLNGGFNTGFYFGGSMAYFFGKKGGTKGGPAPKTNQTARLPRRSGLKF